MPIMPVETVLKNSINMHKKTITLISFRVNGRIVSHWKAELGSEEENPQIKIYFKDIFTKYKRKKTQMIT